MIQYFEGLPTFVLFLGLTHGGARCILPIILQHGAREEFLQACVAGHCPPILAGVRPEQGVEKDVARFYELFGIFAKGLLRCVHSSLTPVEDMEILFRGMALPTEARLDNALRGINRGGVSSATSFTGDALVALKLFPNVRTSPASVFRIRMERCGYAAPRNTLGLLCVFDGFRPLDFSDLSILQVRESECWLWCGQCCVVWTADDDAPAEAQLAKPLAITGRTLPSRVTGAIVARCVRPICGWCSFVLPSPLEIMRR